MKAFDRKAFLAAIAKEDWIGAKSYDLSRADLRDVKILIVSPIGSRAEATYFYGSKDDDEPIIVRCGCYRVDGELPTLAKFAARVDGVYPESNDPDGHGAAYRAAIALARVKLGKKDR
jgi:hypothetical protein